MKLSEFDFDLPKELIAQTPAKPRDASRLMVLRGNEIQNLAFSDFSGFLDDGDVLVINDSKVIPARIHAKKKTGGRVEILLIKEVQQNMWECLVRGKVRESSELQFRTSTGLVYEKKNGRCVIAFDTDDFESFLRAEGSMPLPPYIKKDLENENDYQTTYAKKEGSIAAPTAGLHFTERIIGALNDKGVTVAPITLHVSPGTFLPIRTEDVEEHTMEDEYVHVPFETVRSISEARKAGKKVFAVGTTSTKALETASRSGQIQEYEGWSDLFIYPPYEFKSGIDALITNFHLPRSTLLLLVSAFVGRERLLGAYNEAIKQGYRFYSFGDAMLVLR